REATNSALDPIAAQANARRGKIIGVYSYILFSIISRTNFMWPASRIHQPHVIRLAPPHWPTQVPSYALLFDSGSSVMPQDFQDQLIAFLPKMRVWALALTRNRAAAEDLTQDVATKALVARDCFIPGTNFSAWVHRIMINHFISSVRNRREFTDMDSMPDLPVPAAHEDRTALRELGWALNRLPPDQREALFMIVLQEKSYEAAAEVTGCAIGTLKSRVHRARLQLRAYLTGEPPQSKAA
ncbi:MAG: sigma-70 family RNA polymerase sigma factor, partial [Acetobacteraceae bacterium]